MADRLPLTKLLLPEGDLRPHMEAVSAMTSFKLRGLYPTRLIHVAQSKRSPLLREARGIQKDGVFTARTPSFCDFVLSNDVESQLPAVCFAPALFASGGDAAAEALLLVSVL